ncbi:aspartate aminotransferase family protein [Diaminobutyricibacter tongyongensis]|uniref:Aspartate aminotransferase family protein n=1 Tax=Leifsonia tongyongensis TaxID=1268043 RepID=A0A6L9XU92_9MICO|nr:aspartate aminotransferase family protein [Diaminobutyricibacter tongyongensis]NEN04962.1 aspartate aminotransferase family protein [Diaminobutyricibacter tongyongensis]
MLVTEWPKSMEAWTRTKRSLAGGVSTGLRAQARPHPIFFSGGAGARLTDLDGNTYLDYVLGWGPNIIGHGHPQLVAAVQGQIEHGATYGSGHEFEYLAAEAVLDAYPAFDRLVWSNSGSEAAQVALRIARGATGRQHFVKFSGHYHGWTDPVLVGYRGGRAGSSSAAESLGQSENASRDAVVLEWGNLDDLRATLTGRDIAAVVLEPVLCNSGVIEPPDGYLEGVREICTETGTVLIFDEVITGFRLAFGGAVEKYGVVPDLAVLGKAIAGGLPLSAVVGKSELLDLTQAGVVHAGTYNGNPVVLAGALATLDVLKREGTYERLDALGRRLASGLGDQLTRHGVVGAVNQVGPVVQCALGVPAVRTFTEFMGADTKAYDLLLVELLRRGVFALPGGRWYLSTEHTEHDIDTTIRIFGEVVSVSSPGVGEGS